VRQKEFLALVDPSRVTAAIHEAESLTSGEIRVHVQARLYSKELRFVAERTFERLGMTKTALRNGVLLFIASEESQFYICGDQGIDARVPPGFWDDVAARLRSQFQAGNFTDGIVEAIRMAGEHLAAFFPRATDDVDELSDDIDVQDGE
jgi:uncharacterized membrane protein